MKASRKSKKNPPVGFLWKFGERLSRTPFAFPIPTGRISRANVNKICHLSSANHTRCHYSGQIDTLVLKKKSVFKTEEKTKKNGNCAVPCKRNKSIIDHTFGVRTSPIIKIQTGKLSRCYQLYQYLVYLCIRWCDAGVVIKVQTRQNNNKNHTRIVHLCDHIMDYFATWRLFARRFRNIFFVGDLFRRHLFK